MVPPCLRSFDRSCSTACGRLRLTVVAFPCLAQETPLPPELSFLSKVGKPYRITYEPWTNCKYRREIGEAAGLARWRAESIGRFPSSFQRHDAGCDLGHYQASLPCQRLDLGAGVVWGRARVVSSLPERRGGGMGHNRPGDPERAGVDMVEIAPMPFKFALTPPSATPETVDPAAGDFPWLGPLPGSKFRSSAPTRRRSMSPSKERMSRNWWLPAPSVKTYYARRWAFESALPHRLSRRADRGWLDNRG